jgi:hypothetical protein
MNLPPPRNFALKVRPPAPIFPSGPARKRWTGSSCAIDCTGPGDVHDQENRLMHAG